MKIGTLLSGIGGVEIGAKAAGLELAWGIEINPDVADVANRNLGGHVRVANLLNVNPAEMEDVHILHASPTCTTASGANSNRGETEDDLAIARKVADFIKIKRPKIFTLENVWLYRHFKSWDIILDTLNQLGYWVNMAHVNAADFGVPQTRKRMIVRAVLGGWVPYLPEPEPWVSWYSAIEDLIQTLPASQFAPWQLKRLSLYQTTLVDSAGYPGNDGVRVPVTNGPGRPANTIIANHARRPMRAFIMSGQNSGQNSGGWGRRQEDPAFTVTSSAHKGMDRAWLIGDQASKLRDETHPAFTVRAGATGGTNPRSWLRDGTVVQMTARALARFQSFPDWYELPTSNQLATYGIGNAVPPLLYQKIITGLLTHD